MVSNPDVEMGRLQELMPASGRMKIRLTANPGQAHAIVSEFPRPWKARRLISLNLHLWSQLALPERDLLFLRQVCWSTGVRFFKPDLYRGLGAAGAVGVLVEFLQADAIGVVAAGSLVGLAGLQIWRSQHGARPELAADEAAIKVAQRRGYTEVEAAQHLLGAIESVARIEGRPSLTFVELLRCQNLRAMAKLSGVGVPSMLRDESQ